jgi:HK97 family phage portal protein
VRLFSKKHRRKQEQRSTALSLEDKQLLKALGIESDGIPLDKTKEATFFTCIKILSESVSVLPLKTYKRNGDSADEATAHPLYDLLTLRPNVNMSAVDYWGSVIFQRSYHGFSLSAIEKDPRGQVTGLTPLNSGTVQIWIDDKKIISERGAVWYVYNHNGKEYLYKQDEVLHFKGYTRDGITSLSVAGQLRENVETLQNSSQFLNEHFGNGLSVGGVLQYTGDLDQNAVNRMKAKFEDMAIGVKNAGKILPIPYPFQFNNITPSMVDNQFLELNKMSVTQIAAAFGIKLHMLGYMDNAKFNNVTAMNDQFYRDTLLPILTEIEQETNYKLLGEDERKTGHYLQYNVDSLLRADLLTRYQAYQIAHDSGFMKANEIRRRENMPRYEGGDRLIVNGTFQPLEKVGMAYEKTEPVKEDEDLKGGEEDK